MLSLGQRFRQQREQQKISLDVIAERTKINPRYLQAIETENFEDLPAGLFRRSFVRQYANALNLNDPTLEVELDELLGPGETGRDSAFPLEPQDDDVVDVEPLPALSAEPSGEHRMVWAVGLLVFTLVSCSAIYALWERTQGVGADPQTESAPQQQLAEAHRIAPRALEPAPEPVRSDQPEITEPAVTAQPPVDQAQPVQPKQQPLSAQEPPEAARLKEVLPDAPAVQLPPAPPQLPKPKADKIVVEVTASEKVWVRTTSDHQTVFRGMLGPQERKSFKGGKRTRVLVGDAGAVEVIWNGKPIGPIGRSGQMRVIEFTPESFLILSP